MDARTVPSEQGSATGVVMRTTTGRLVLNELEVTILCEVHRLGEKAHHNAVMQAVGQVVGAKPHKQNFRRFVEYLAERGYLAQHACNFTHTGGRPARRRFTRTKKGAAAVVAFRKHQRSLRKYLRTRAREERWPPKVAAA